MIRVCRFNNGLSQLSPRKAWQKIEQVFGAKTKFWLWNWGRRNTVNYGRRQAHSLLWRSKNDNICFRRPFIRKILDDANTKTNLLREPTKAYIRVESSDQGVLSRIKFNNWSRPTLTCDQLFFLDPRLLNMKLLKTDFVLFYCRTGKLIKIAWYQNYKYIKIQVSLHCICVQAGGDQDFPKSSSRHTKTDRRDKMFVY